ncbi:DUF6444 domain-containing protein, partial [Desulfatibacillum aliphaticivorans]|uniref:DUF6444 domain-containing protein n=1 Tax=Desulfatibacillum aliphaticivorans TaxID=218208 RepID=UPI00200A4376
MKPDSLPQEIWNATPEFARRVISEQAEAIALLVQQTKRLAARVEQLEAQLNKNSGNSSKPPSSDPPYQGPAKSKKSKKGGKKRGGQKGHKGHRQALMPPTRIMDVKPDQCSCGSRHLEPCKDAPFYIHQVVELPEIVMDVT